ncbi:MAG: MoaD/ThiS family protein [Proteobacteria bacterium]|nr:MoaD/ThiS family protein [Pseudomonadota bacterium]
MIDVNVTFFSYIKFETGLGELRVSLKDDSTVSDLVEELTALHGDKLAKFLVNREKRKYISIFLVENEMCNPSRKLKQNDTVMIMPTVAGG